MNKEQLLKVFLVLFWWRNILDILGIKGIKEIYTLLIN